MRGEEKLPGCKDLSPHLNLNTKVKGKQTPTDLNKDTIARNKKEAPESWTEMPEKQPDVHLLSHDAHRGRMGKGPLKEGGSPEWQSHVLTAGQEETPGHLLTDDYINKDYLKWNTWTEIANTVKMPTPGWVQLRGGALAQHALGPGFHPQHRTHTKKNTQGSLNKTKTLFLEGKG